MRLTDETIHVIIFAVLDSLSLLANAVLIAAIVLRYVKTPSTRERTYSTNEIFTTTPHNFFVTSPYRVLIFGKYEWIRRIFLKVTVPLEQKN